MTVKYTPRDDPNDFASWPHVIIDNLPDPVHGNKDAKVYITSRGANPDHTYTQITSTHTSIAIVFNEQSLEEFYLAHKLVLEDMKKREQ